MDEDTESLFEFPCEFPIKVMGLAADDFDTMVVEIVMRHVDSIKEGAVAVRPSRNGKYLAVTVTFEAQNQDQIDELYRELSGHERVLMAI